MTVFVSLRGCLDASDQSTGIAQTERQRDREAERQRGASGPCREAERC